MDQEAEIKEEPVWLEGTASTSLENVELVWETIPLKQETKSEVTEAGSTQESAFEPSADIKEEIFVEQLALFPYAREENDVENFPVQTKATGESAYYCTVCGLKFSQEGDLKKHKLNHSEGSPHVCNIRKRVHHKKIMKRHMDIRTKNIPYLCEKCGKIFKKRPNLRIHMVTHNGDRPYSCKQCDSTFKLRSNLRKHMFTHTGEKPYSCELCGKTFNTRTNLRCHKVIHTGDRPYNCKECDRTFNKPDNLKRHMFTHTGERPYTCEECGRTFSERGNLRSHMIIHTNDRPYSCKICDRTFSNRSSMRRHVVIHTREES